MKLPRWLIVSMLAACALAMLTIAGWWWVTWPERTTRHFLSLIQGGDFEATNPVLIEAAWSAPSDSWVEFEMCLTHEKFTRKTARSRWQAEFRDPKLKLQPRSWTDRIIGRQYFHTEFSDHQIMFATERGKVRFVELRELKL